jgi:glutamate dehydrogenase
MTDEVGLLSLKSNYIQSQTISTAEDVSSELMEPYKRLMHNLEHKGLLDRAIEFLPTDEEIDNRIKIGKGLTRPELAVLMAYAKMDLNNTLLASHLPNESVLESMYLYNYFPAPLLSKYKKLMDDHKLKTEIVATEVTNDLINRMGLTFIDRMREETGSAECTITRAFVIAKQLIGADDLYSEIDALDNISSAEAQKEMRHTVKKLMERVAYWFLRNGEERPLDIEKAIAKYSAIFKEVMKEMPKASTPLTKKRIGDRIAQWETLGLSKGLAIRFAYLTTYNSVPDLASIQLITKHNMLEVIEAYYATGAALDMYMLHGQTRAITVENNWQRIGRISIVDSLFNAQSEITSQVLGLKKRSRLKTVDDAMDKWLERRSDNVKQYQALSTEVRNADAPSHAMLSVILGQIKGLSQLKD